MFTHGPLLLTANYFLLLIEANIQMKSPDLESLVLHTGSAPVMDVSLLFGL